MDKDALFEKMRKLVDPKLQNENWHQAVVGYKPPEYRKLLHQLYSKIVIFLFSFFAKQKLDSCRNSPKMEEFEKNVEEY